MRPRPKARSWLLALGSVLAVVTVVSCTYKRGKLTYPTLPERSSRIFDQIPGRDLRRDPPRIESMEVKILASETEQGNAVMMVRLAPEEVRLTQLIVEDEGGRVVLRDDGRGGDQRAADGVLSGVFRLDVEQLERNRKRILDIARRMGGSLTVPVFNQREKIGERPVRFTDRPIRRGEAIDFRDLDFGIWPAVDREKSLLIRNPGVVRNPDRTYDPCGPIGGPLGGPFKKWSFAYLVDEMYNKSSPPITSAELAVHWLTSWTAVQVPNGLPIAARNAPGNGITDKLIKPWLAASGGSAFDLRKAPFRLAAIVNRLDLADNPVYGGGNAGELRFVFGAVDIRNGGCNPLPFAVIFEFGVPLSGCKSIRSWAQQWQALSSMDPATEAYRQALENLTEQVVKHGLGGSKPNGSALNQLRTNDFTLAPLWELREFRLQGDHLLRMTTVAQSPASSFDGSPILRDYINGDAAAILSGNHVVPLFFPTVLSAFRAGAAPVPNDFWNAAGILPGEVRHKFSLSTCNGCHRSETATPFLHIDPQSSPAGLSSFLTGGAPQPATSPVAGEPAHAFHDLADRATNLDAVANNQCIFLLGRPPQRKALLDFRPDEEIRGKRLLSLPSLPRTRMVH